MLLVVLLLLLFLLVLLLILLLLLLYAQKGINREANQQLVIHISTIFGETHKMPPHTSGICLKSHIYYDSLKRHMRTKHPTDESEEKVIKRSKKENDGFCNIVYKEVEVVKANPDLTEKYPNTNKGKIGFLDECN